MGSIPKELDLASSVVESKVDMSKSCRCESLQKGRQTNEKNDRYRSKDIYRVSVCVYLELNEILYIN